VVGAAAEELLKHDAARLGTLKHFGRLAFAGRL
jgi:hypothetical protein